MPRALSVTARGAVFAPETDEVFILLLTISHADLSAPIRVTPDQKEVLPIASALNPDTRGVISRGQEFIGFPFEITLPNEDEDQSPRAQLRIDNVSREIVRAVRSIRSPADVTVEIVLASEPDTVETALEGFQMRSVTYNALTVEGDLTVEQFDLEPYPSRRMTPSNYPGLF